MRKIFTAVPILGFAYSRSKIAEKLDEPMMRVIQHLVKIWRYPQSEDVNHWEQEVYSLLNRTYSMKGSNKYPSANFIFQKTYGVNEDKISGWITKMIRRCDDRYDIIREDTDAMNSAIREYFLWLSEEFSADGYVLAEDVYDKLEELGFRKNNETVH